MMKIALAGVSHWHAAIHADAVRSAGAELCGAWDWDHDIARSFAATWDCAAHARVEDLIASAPDLVVVMGHPARVPELAEAIIASGLPMMLEKPAATDTATLEALAAKARAGNTFVAVPLPNRLSAAIEGLDGRPVAHAHFRIVNGPPQRYRDDGVSWVLDPAIGGGGPLRNLGIHGIDCALSLAQGTLRIVSAQVAKRLHPTEAVEDHCHVVLIDEAGALFTIEAGYTVPDMAPGGDYEWRTVTADSYLIDHGSRVRSFGPGNKGPEELPPPPPGSRYRAFMADTVQRLASGQPPLVTLDDYVAAMKLIDDIYRAGQP
jgi:predicted dehydrogenase